MTKHSPEFDAAVAEVEAMIRRRPGLLPAMKRAIKLIAERSKRQRIISRLEREIAALKR